MADENVIINEENEVVNGTNEFDEIVKNIIANGGKKIKNLKVCNCSYNEDYPTTLCLTLDKAIPQFIIDRESGDRVKGTSKTFYVSLYAVVSILKRMDNYKWLGKKINDKPQLAEVFLSEATIDVLQTEEPEGTAYINPFSRNQEAQEPFDSDKIITHVIRIEIGGEAKDTCKAYMLKCLDI